ncbi:MAG: exo-alpha-sialidase [Clostridia bacterium]|nr:exo-alpha-sialidase [Clostridia bacterium]
MKITVKETKIICENPYNPHHNYFAWPTVARLRDGRLAMVASGFRIRHVCPFGKVVMCISEDEGKTWTRPTVVMDTPLDDRDAGILPFGENSVMITSFNNTGKMQKKWNNLTDENGNLNPRSLYIRSYLECVDYEKAEERYLGSTMIFSHDGAKTFGEVMRVPVTSPHGPLLMPDGSILYIGRTFSCDDTKQESDCIESYRIMTDGSYEKLGEIENISPDLLSCEPHAIALQDGTILVHIRVQNGIFTIFQSESHDGGRTFTKPHQILSDQGGAPAHLIQTMDGTLISVYGYREKPYGIKAMFSTNNGHTWDTGHDLYINGISSDLGYPASVQLENGDILTVFYAKTAADSPAVIMQTVWKFEK